MSALFPNESKKRVQFEEPSAQLTKSAKKGEPTDSEQKIKIMSQNALSFGQQIRFSFTDSIDSILGDIEQKQSDRLEQMKALVLTCQGRNKDFIDELRSVREQVKQSQAQNERNTLRIAEQQQQVNLLGGQTRQQNINTQQNNLNENTQQLQFRQLQSQQQPTSQPNSQGQYSQFEITRQSLPRQRQSQINYSNRGNEGSFQLAGDINIKSLKTLVDDATARWGRGMQFSFQPAKVEDYEERLVDGFYFTLRDTRGKIVHEFYIYEIPHLQEVEFNPIVICGRNINEGNDYETYQKEQYQNNGNQFEDILSFATSQLLGFFQSFLQFSQKYIQQASQK